MDDVQMRGIVVLTTFALGGLMLAFPKIIGWFLGVGVSGLLVWSVLAALGALS